MIQTLADGVFELTTEQRMPGGFFFPLRMTVLRLEDGCLLLHSPVHIDDAMAEALARLGPVRYLVAPNLFHHLYLNSAAERYPEAQVLVAPGLQRKRGDLPAHKELTDGLKDPFEGQVRWQGVGGVPGLNEVVLFHEPSRTLVVCDLLFNIHEARGWLSPWVFRAAGAWQKPAQSRLVRAATRDRQAAGASVREVLGWGFDRVVMSHGQVIDDGGKAAFEQALSWMIG